MPTDEVCPSCNCKGDLAEQERREDEERWERYQLTGHFVDNNDAMEWLDALVKGVPTHISTTLN